MWCMLRCQNKNRRAYLLFPLLWSACALHSIPDFTHWCAPQSRDALPGRAPQSTTQDCWAREAWSRKPRRFADSWERLCCRGPCQSGKERAERAWRETERARRKAENSGTATAGLGLRKPGAHALPHRPGPSGPSKPSGRSFQHCHSQADLATRPRQLTRHFLSLQSPAWPAQDSKAAATWQVGTAFGSESGSRCSMASSCFKALWRRCSLCPWLRCRAWKLRCVPAQPERCARAASSSLFEAAKPEMAQTGARRRCRWILQTCNILQLEKREMKLAGKACSLIRRRFKYFKCHGIVHDLYSLPGSHAMLIASQSFSCIVNAHCWKSI